MRFGHNGKLGTIAESMDGTGLGQARVKGRQCWLAARSNAAVCWSLAVVRRLMADGAMPKTASGLSAWLGGSGKQLRTRALIAVLARWPRQLLRSKLPGGFGATAQRLSCRCGVSTRCGVSRTDAPGGSHAFGLCGAGLEGALGIDGRFSTGTTAGRNNEIRLMARKSSGLGTDQGDGPGCVANRRHLFFLASGGSRRRLPTAAATYVSGYLG